MKKLTVCGRFLAYESGEPFFYLADTAWELFHRLNREEAQAYFAQRKRQGFTAVQAVALAEFEGVTTPNSYGRLPFLFKDGTPDPTAPDTEGEYSYWDHVDYIVDLAAECGIFVTLLPTWGDKYNLIWGKGPVIFNEENAEIYGAWIGARYAQKENIIYMLGGDRPLEPCHRRIIDRMAKGIKKADQNHLITFHPSGCSDSTECVLDAPYIDFHTLQSGHNTVMSYKSDEVLLQMAQKTPLPYMDSEPRYEDHPPCFNGDFGYYYTDAEVRQNAYWDVFTGACGHTYGNHCVWSMTREPTNYFPYTYKDALCHKGAEQMRHLRTLRESYDYFSFSPAPELIGSAYAGMGHMAAARGKGYAFLYSPLGIPFTVKLSGFSEDSEYLRAFWFDPRNGEKTIFAALPKHGDMTLVPPSQGMGCDWVLILEEVNSKKQ